MSFRKPLIDSEQLRKQRLFFTPAALKNLETAPLLLRLLSFQVQKIRSFSLRPHEKRRFLSIFYLS